MWEQYKKTVASTQVLIAMVTIAALIASHRFYIAGGFFIAMQFGALFGAMWATRLRRLVLHRGGTLPERRG
jgi:hypothetical protein